MAHRHAAQTIPMQKMNSSKTSLPQKNGYANDSFHQPPPPLPRNSLIGAPDLSEVKKALLTHNGGEYQLIPVEIEKDAEMGLVIGQIENDSWIFIDEILPNGMIDMHGILKEGDFLIQAGSYNLQGVDVSSALILIERAYDEGKKTVAFVAARQEKDAKSKSTPPAPVVPIKPPKPIEGPASRAQSFVEYEEEMDNTQF